MTYILSEQRNRDDYSGENFEKYMEYLNRNKSKFSEKIFDFFSDKKWYDLDGFGPHDSFLEEICLKEKAASSPDEKNSSFLYIKLCMPGGGLLNLEYIDCICLTHSKTEDISGIHGVWLYDEVETVSPDFFTHHIEFSNSAKLSITASDLRIVR